MGRRPPTPPDTAPEAEQDRRGRPQGQMSLFAKTVADQITVLFGKPICEADTAKVRLSEGGQLVGERLSGRPV